MTRPVKPDASTLVLGIETSCDETAVGVVRGRTVLANELAATDAATTEVVIGGEPGPGVPRGGRPPAHLLRARS